MRKLLIVTLLSICVLAGCGNNGNDTSSSSEASANSEDVKQQTDFEIDREKLESEGYEDIAGIAYAKIEDNEGEPVVYLVCHKNQPEQNIYLWSQITSNIEHISDYSITWNGKEYFLDMESKDVKTEEDMFALLPPDWEETLKTMLIKGDGAAGIVSKSDADDIDRAVESFASKYLKDGELEVISKKEYTVDGDNISFSLTKRGDKITFTVDGDAKVEEKAYLIYGAVLVEFENLQNEFYECSANIHYGDLYVLHSQYEATSVISGLNRNGDFVMELPDWLDKDMDNLNLSEEKLENYILELEKTMQDFGKSCGYSMGYLLDK